MTSKMTVELSLLKAITDYLNKLNDLRPEDVTWTNHGVPVTITDAMLNLGYFAPTQSFPKITGLYDGIESQHLPLPKEGHIRVPLWLTVDVPTRYDTLWSPDGINAFLISVNEAIYSMRMSLHKLPDITSPQVQALKDRIQRRIDLLDSITVNGISKV